MFARRFFLSTGSLSFVALIATIARTDINAHLRKTNSGASAQVQVPHLIPPDPAVLAKEQAAWKFLEEARQDGRSTDERLALLDKCAAALGRVTYDVESYRAFFLAKAKRYDEA